MKERYLDVMEYAVNAYTLEHIHKYTKSVEEEGIKEHGFPRLTSNIGILIAHGRRKDLLPEFIHMMDLCTEQIPVMRKINGEAVGNDFSVREISFVLLEAEKNKVTDQEKINTWRENLKKINPYDTYTDIAVPKIRIGNWAQFAATSEVLRKYAGIGSEDRFIEDQIASQVPYFDENGFYRDPNEPMLYDLMTRLQMCMALYFGYSGKYADCIHENLMKASMPTLYMQSVTGELPYGGRSNQFLFNEAAISAMCEYYAAEYKKAGNLKQAAAFKRAAKIAVDSIFKWLERKDVHHIKNFYPSDSTYGCEAYAYFDKYMVTLGSNIYCAYAMADDSIEEAESCPAEEGGFTYKTGEWFHKVFLNNGKYFVELDYRADYHYDASGIGRIHLKDAPYNLILNMPFTDHPTYDLDTKNPFPFSICSALIENGRIHYGSEKDVSYYLLPVHDEKDDVIMSRFECDYSSAILTETCELKEDGVLLNVRGRRRKESEVAIAFPVLKFDGETESTVTASENRVVVSYKGWKCCFESENPIEPLNLEFANRNGHYTGWIVKNEKEVSLKIYAEKE